MRVHILSSIALGYAFAESVILGKTDLIPITIMLVFVTAVAIIEVTMNDMK